VHRKLEICVYISSYDKFQVFYDLGNPDTTYRELYFYKWTAGSHFG